MTINIYSVTNEYFEALIQLDTIEELPPEVIENTLQGLAGNHNLEVAAWSKNLELQIEQMKEHEKKITEKRRKLEKKLDDFKTFLLKRMADNNITKIECSEFKIYRKQNPEKVVIEKGAIIPEEYCRVEYHPDKLSLKVAIQDGIGIEGVSIERDERIEIRGNGEQ